MHTLTVTEPDVHGFREADPERIDKIIERNPQATTKCVLWYEPSIDAYQLVGPGGSFELPLELNQHIRMIIEGKKSKEHAPRCA